MTTTTWRRTEALDHADCLALLSSARVGRVGWMGDDGPQILPVNHTVLDGTVLFRTDLYTSLADASSAGVVAFEADELDDLMSTGWSVMLTGRVEQVQDPPELAALFQRMRPPWAPGSRPVVTRIVPSHLSGRRFAKD
jgi:nitroimidazol reductase NimA-like FMN-containing flavoprotein (pyridoxamine 5'-phosphate oxidase superfamily)